MLKKVYRIYNVHYLEKKVYKRFFFWFTKIYRPRP